jgi:putative phage-type endonuclease
MSAVMSMTARKPAVELVDITTLSEADWHIWRKKGIGGSDLASVMGMSPWSTAKDIWRKKKGIVGALDEEADQENWIAKEVGHLLEPLVAKIFAHKTGLVPYEIRKMFAHPDYDFMIANVDYFVTLPDGRRAILECKTSNHYAKEKWEGDAVPLNYEYQCRHYMAIMDIDVAYIACLMGNNEGDFVWRRIDRDLAIEADIIATEIDFWENYVTAGVEPPYTENADLVLQSIRNHYGHPDKNANEIELPPAFADTLGEFEHLKAEKSKVDKASDAIKEQMKRTQAIIVEEMGEACRAVCRGSDGAVYTITNNPIQRDEVDKDGLKAIYPQAYDAFVSKKNTSPRFNVKKAKAKVS